MTIHGIAVRRIVSCRPGFEVSDDLVAEQIEVNPMLRTAALRKPKYGAIEMPCGVKIVDGKGYVKRTQRGHGFDGSSWRLCIAGAVEGCTTSGLKEPLKEVANQLSWDGRALSPADEMGIERAAQLGSKRRRGIGERVTEIILADNQAVFRAGAARVLAHENDLKVVGECTDVQRMKEIAIGFARPVVIFPSSFTSELEDVLRWLRASGARSIVILEHGVTLPERLARQSNGFLTRSVTGPQLLDTLRRVAIGQHVPQRTGIKEMPSPDHAGTQVVQRLTPKELQIVALVSEGAKNREIGVRLGTKEQVVKNYLRSIYDKVGVSDRLELALYTVHHRTLNEAVERVRATLARSA